MLLADIYAASVEQSLVSRGLFMASTHLACPKELSFTRENELEHEWCEKTL